MFRDTRFTLFGFVQPTNAAAEKERKKKKNARGQKAVTERRSEDWDEAEARKRRMNERLTAQTKHVSCQL